MGVQKPTRHTRRLKAVPARREKTKLDTRTSLDRRAGIARAAGISKTTRASSEIGSQRLPEFGINEGDAGYLGYETGGIRVSKERMIHSEPRMKKKSR